MSIVESLNSEPEIIVNEEKTCSCNCHKEENNSEEEEEENNSEEEEEENNSEEEEENNSEEEEEENNSEEEEKSKLYTVVENSTLYCVSINEKPAFYCSTLEDAQDQAKDCLRNMINNYNYKYFLDFEDYKITLYSQYKFFILPCDSVEAVATISKIHRIQFTNKSD